MTLAIDVVGLKKHFDVRAKSGRLRRTRQRVVAVEHVDLGVEPAEMVGFIGPNGAGKSTTIKMLTGILAPSSGNLRVLGHVPLDERTALAKRIGVVFGQRTQLWWDLPLAESFSLLRHVYRVPAADHARTMSWLTDLFDLGPLMAKPVRALSLGQRMRGEIAAALAHQPELLFLDEPTIGLDVVSKHAVRSALEQLNRERGTTVILTTHDLADIEQLCPRVVIIDHGRVIEDGSLDALVDRLGGTRTMVVELDSVQPNLVLDGVRCTRIEGTRQWLEFDRSRWTAAEVLSRVTEHADVRDLAIEEPDIEEIVRRIYVGKP